MAINAATAFEVASTGSDGNAGADTNGGGFNPLNANPIADLAGTSANTSSPVVTSATYTFLARDVGHWVFIKSGTNWTPGWYKIASVAAGAATLSAAASAAVLYATGGPTGLNTSAGCATTASPTAGSFYVDYSQGGTAAAAVTDGVTAGTTTITSATASFAKQMAGNLVYVSGGTGSVVANVYEIVSVTNATTIVVDRSTGLTAGTGVTLNVGGCMSSPGNPGRFTSGIARIWLKNGTYSITSASANVSGGCVTIADSGGGSNYFGLFGYNALRTDAPTGSSRPTLQASGISSFTLVTLTNQAAAFYLILDGGSLTSSRGIGTSGSGGGWAAYRVSAKNCTNSAFANAYCHSCDATTCSTAAAFLDGNMENCVAWSNTFTGFAALGGISAFWTNCISVNNSGASSHGFDSGTSNANNNYALNCTAFGNGKAGFNIPGRDNSVAWYQNCISYGNTGNGFDASSATACSILINCAAGGNSTNFSTNLFAGSQIGSITLTGNPFNNSASGDFSLNNTAGAGAACRAAGILGAFPGISTTGYLDLGAVQHQDSGGGGGTTGYVFGG